MNRCHQSEMAGGIFVERVMLNVEYRSIIFICCGGLGFPKSALPER